MKIYRNSAITAASDESHIEFIRAFQQKLQEVYDMLDSGEAIDPIPDNELDSLMDDIDTTIREISDWFSNK